MTDRNVDSQLFRLEAAEGGIWKLTFDMPGEKVNKLDLRVLAEAQRVLPRLEEMGRSGLIRALVLVSGKPGSFIAGADIGMIRAARSADEVEKLSLSGQALMNRWEALPFPTVAAIEGLALGGGLEFALACSAMVMSEAPGTRVGFPEVMLGLIPGMGGCARLPRKVGLATSLDVILNARQLSPRTALREGVAEAVLPSQNFPQLAVDWTQRNLKALQGRRRLARPARLGGVGGKLGTMIEKTPMGRSLVLIKAREKVMKKTRGKYPALLEALQVVRHVAPVYGSRVGGEKLERALAVEAKAFGRLSATETSKNLIGLFYLIEDNKKSSLPLREKPLRQAMVVGAGVMGSGIARVLADQGISVRLVDERREGLEAGYRKVTEDWERKQRDRKITARELVQKTNLVIPSLHLEGCSGVELAIEAIVENLDAKNQLIAELENRLRPDAVIASNTSSLSVSEMQKSMKNPERLVGMHFFNPVPKMPLVEIVRGTLTSDAAAGAVFETALKLGKTPILVKDSPGFLVNRVLGPYLNEALHLLMEGAPIDEIDEALLEFGMPMGPMELIDEVGVDVAEKVGRILQSAYGDRMVPAREENPLVPAGRLGKKSGKGLYAYHHGRDKALDANVYAILGVKPQARSVSPTDIVDRCVLPMINEAARCLAEGVVRTPRELDLGMTLGTGFAPFRGGLLRYADTLGAEVIVATLKHLAKTHGKRFLPSPALMDRAMAGQPFHATEVQE